MSKRPTTDEDMSGEKNMEWKPIESAPKEDYAHYLVLVPMPDDPTNLDHRIAMWDPENGDWTVYMAAWDPQPVYWMRLPEPPALSKQEG